MITEQKLKRTDLALQRTSDDYFEATTTLKKYNSKQGVVPKMMSEYTKLKSTKEYVAYLENVEGIIKPIKTNTVHGTWMHPHIYVDFCMWLSVEFKSFAIQMVLDGLVKMRHSAGDYFSILVAKKNTPMQLNNVRIFCKFRNFMLLNILGTLPLISYRTRFCNIIYHYIVVRILTNLSPLVRRLIK